MAHSILHRLRENVRSALQRDLKLAGAQQVVWLVLTSLLLDGGNAFHWSVAGFAGFWLGVVLLVARRLPYARRTDRWFVRYASLLLAVLAVGIEPIVHRYTHWAFVQPR